MLGIVYYLLFILIGLIYSCIIFKEKDIYFKIWSGLIFGNVILMAGIIPFALLFNFSYISHILLLITAAAPIIVLSIKNKELIPEIRTSKSAFIKKQLTQGNEQIITNKIFLFLIVPITLLICVLMTNHILTPYGNGAVSSGQSTYGDLQMHLGFVTSIAEQKTFPPQYCFLAGTKLNYPFLIDSLSSSLYLFGCPLRLAVLIPSFMFALCIVMGFYILAFTVTKNKAAAVLATLFFFLNGGFGFAYFLEGAKEDSTVFTKFFTEYYQTPTNYNEENIRWSNTICDMIIPQRTTMAGWCFILFELYMLITAVKNKKTSYFIILGIIAGCMPMIHTHSLLALGIISAVMFFMYLYNEKDKKEYVKLWIYYGAITCVLALPQLFFWTFSQTTGNSSFLRFAYNWVNHSDPYIWFYLKNWGITFLFIIPAFFNTNKDNKKLLLSCLGIFLIAEFVLFQPNEYDNNKLFYVAYMVAVIIVSEFLVMLYGKLKDVKLKEFFAGLVIICGTLSGTLTIIREYHSGGMYQTFSKADIAFSEFLKENTESDAVFLTGTQHTNPVPSLAGRTIYVGSSLYVHFHGFGNEFASRNKEIKTIYEGSYEQMKNFSKENNISYIFVGPSESYEYKINTDALSHFEVVYNKDDIQLYKVN